MNKVTTDEILGNASKITFITGDKLPEAGSAEAFSLTAQRLWTVEAHAAAIAAWKRYPVASWGGAMLRAARIRTHEQAIAAIALKP